MKRYCIIHVAKTKALISLALTTKQVCTLVFAYADCRFSDVVAHIQVFPGAKEKHS